jgi:hypothetical protein
MVFENEELRILTLLDDCIRRPLVRRAIGEIIPRVEGELSHDPTKLLAWEPIPLDLYEGRLPAMIRSSWVFILRAGCTSGAERHPNSHQRMASFRGAGDFQIQFDDQWTSNFLTDDSGVPVNQRWVSIPVNVWHQAVVPDKHWVVVSFHTVPDDELIEERPDSNDAVATRQRLYLGKSHQP